MIQVPNSIMTYAIYALYLLTPGLVAISLIEDDRNYLYLAVVFLIVMMITSYIDLLRGERYARKKVKIGTSKLHEFRRRGWT